MEQIKCTPGDLDTVREQFAEFSHFTVRKGKAQYHMFYLPDRSCGIYYAVRVGDQGFIEAKRALEPSDEIICWGNL